MEGGGKELAEEQQWWKRSSGDDDGMGMDELFTAAVKIKYRAVS
jgi:hypothetical protein